MTAKPIVAATDGSEHSLRAVEWAAREALLRGAPLRIVSVAAMPPRMMEEQDVEDIDTVGSILRRNRDDALATAAGRAATAAPDLLIDTDVLTGAPAEAIVESGAGALMLVVGSRGMGAFAAMVLGSVSRYAASNASCPAVVVRDEASSQHGLVGVGLGDLDSHAAALTFAFEEAAARKASLTVIHAADTSWVAMLRPGESSAAGGPPAGAAAGGRLADLLAAGRTKYPEVPVSQDVVHGHPGQVLVELSARADLVVIGRHTGHPGLAGLGAVRHAVLHHAHGPVAVVPST
jgi:nucleotide-binding universal stress UspA family protein